MDIDLIKIKKYIGSCCGNNFIILDCRNIKLHKKDKVNFSLKNIIKYGVDSALFINNQTGFDFSIEIFEKDGTESESCGNGIILIANFLGLNTGIVKMKNSVVIVEGNKRKQAVLMDIKFSHIKEIINEKKCLFVKAGEPHIVFLVDNLDKFDLVKIGEKMQRKYSNGVNVDVIQKIDEFHYLIKTYERGVFSITKSCGTGSMSAYIAISYFNNKIYNKPIEFKSIGGKHWISKTKNMFRLETLKKFCEIKDLINK